MQSKIKIFLNNNPKCETTIESVPKKEIWEMKNVPYIRVNGEGIENGHKKIQVSIDGENLYNNIIKVDNNSFELKIELDEPLENPKNGEVLIDNEKHEIPINLKRLYGTVKYFHGSPVEKPVISVTGTDIISIGDKDGNFELYLSEKEKQIGVFQKDYSKKTLEAWIYNLDLKEDARFDIKIDKMEVYGIHMWKKDRADFLHFTPMSLTRTQEAMKGEFENQLELLKYEELWPKLDKSNVKIYADNEEVKILAFQEIGEFLLEYEGKEYFRPSYVASIPKGHENKIIKIEIESKFVTEDGEIIEKGEGYYFG